MEKFHAIVKHFRFTYTNFFYKQLGSDLSHQVAYIFKVFGAQSSLLVA